MKRFATGILLLILSAALRAAAQTQRVCEIPGKIIATADSLNVTGSASISGTLRDERGNPIVNAFVECFKGGVIQGRDLTDFDGIYSIPDLNPGTMDVVFKFQGRELKVADVLLNSYTRRTVNGTLPESSTPPVCSYRIICIRYSYIDPKHPGGRITHAGNMLW